MEAKTTKSGSAVAAVPKRSSARSAGFGKQLDPALKSWLDNVIIPALVRQYVAETERSNRLAAGGGSELPSN